VGPGRRACFNVAIRTAVLRRDGASVSAEYGTGGGVVWDSAPADEYRECLLKALVLTAPARPRFELLETMRWQPRRGLLRRREHLRRLAASASYFGRPFDPAKAEQALVAASSDLPSRSHRVRLLLDARGEMRVEVAPLAAAPRRPRVALAARPVDAADPLLFHKTTHRGLYERARRDRPEVDEVLLYNRAGELTEASRANVVVARGGRLVTPPLACGLLPGVLREGLLRRGVIHEEVVPVNELHEASEIWLISSLRGWRRALLVPPTER
jgi:para-aminobenzoate synthetase/4-amino-4-deoxychorismate lyase